MGCFPVPPAIHNLWNTHIHHKPPPQVQHKAKQKEVQQQQQPTQTQTQKQKPEPQEQQVQPPPKPKLMTVYDPKKVVVVFVLGGPGTGKGTQCALLVKSSGFCHFSAGDLLREEQQREGSEYGETIRTYIKEGAIVPMEITIKLLENAIKKEMESGRTGDGWGDGKGRFLVDGFPRKMDQAEKFENDVCPSAMTVFYSGSVEIMQQRLKKRGETSGREDDNDESIKKRLVTYREQTKPVIDHFDSLGKVIEIDCANTIEEVHEETLKKVFERLSSLGVESERK